VPAAVVLDVFETLTVIEPVAVSPPVSVARAVSVWLPFAILDVFHEYDQLCVPVASANAPESTRTSTLERPALSDAVPRT
jgi:hypothetical protein